MDKLISFLDQNQIVLGDGAFGTMLQAAGLESGEAPEGWNVTLTSWGFMVRPGSFQARLFHLGEVGLGRPALRANPVVRDVLEGRAGLDIVLGISGLRIVNIAAHVADVLVHALSWFPDPPRMASEGAKVMTSSAPDSTLFLDRGVW